MEDWIMKKILSLLTVLCLLMGLGTAFAEGESALPLAGQHLKIALSPDFMYFETVSETDETGYEGLDIDVIKLLSQKLGFTFEIVPMGFSALIGALQTNDVDFVISGMSYTDERAQVVDFSITYCITDVGCVVPVDSEIASFADLQNKTVACSQGTTYELLIEGIPGATLKTFQGQAAVGNAVAEGLDGVVAGLTSINGSKKLSNTVLDADGSPKLKYFVLEGEGTADQYNIAFPKGSALVELVNGVLKELQEDGTLDALIKQWLY